MSETPKPSIEPRNAPELPFPGGLPESSSFATPHGVRARAAGRPRKARQLMGQPAPSQAQPTRSNPQAKTTSVKQHATSLAGWLLAKIVTLIVDLAKKLYEKALSAVALAVLAALGAYSLYYIPEAPQPPPTPIPEAAKEVQAVEDSWTRGTTVERNGSISKRTN